jgi:hypothetical protein
MKRAMRNQFICMSIAALVAVASGCKRADNGNPGAMNSASSGVLSNSAGPSGTAGTDVVVTKK